MSGIYVHIPYCRQKCHYCDFHFSVSMRTKNEMLLALKKEIVLRQKEITAPIKTIYFGGGTPSVLNISELQMLLDTIYETFSVIENPEITLEANPDDLSFEYIKELSKTAINRLSIGIQSFFDDDLVYMNRSHNAKQAKQAVLDAKSLGFSNITIDLIYGVPGMTIDKWRANLTTFLSLDIPHLSAYALTVETHTALDYFIKIKKYQPIDEQLASIHFNILREVMLLHDYGHYELSNFAKLNYESKHNTGYWLGKPYLGIGPSAHSFDLNTRSWNVRSNTKYIKSLSLNNLPSEKEILSVSDRYNEYIMVNLRTTWGVSLDRLKRDFGIKYFDYFMLQIKTYLDKEILQIFDKSIGLGMSYSVVVSPKSFFLIDGIIADLFWVD